MHVAVFIVDLMLVGFVFVFVESEKGKKCF